MAMRKLKLQVQMTVDGFVAGPEGQLDWMTRNLDEGVIARIVQITDSSDTILLGSGMALIEHDLIDELNIFVNPVAIGQGMRIFKDRKALRLTGSQRYPSGIVINTYEPVR